MPLALLLAAIKKITPQPQSDGWVLGDSALGEDTSLTKPGS